MIFGYLNKKKCFFFLKKYFSFYFISPTILKTHWLEAILFLFFDNFVFPNVWISTILNFSKKKSLKFKSSIMFLMLIYSKIKVSLRKWESFGTKRSSSTFVSASTKKNLILHLTFQGFINILYKNYYELRKCSRAIYNQFSLNTLYLIMKRVRIKSEENEEEEEKK